jgi:hypothetical protein
MHDLVQVLRPFMLRRLKEAVAAELPSKVLLHPPSSCFSPGKLRLLSLSA